MFSKFDSEAQRVLILARKEMMDLKHPYVGSEHLLLAILHCYDLKVTKLLETYDIRYDNFRNEVIRVIGLGKAESNWFLYTPLLKRVIENAIIDCRDEGCDVGVSNLLISLLSEGEGVANRLLLGMNIDVELLYDNFVKSVCSNSSETRRLLISSYSVDFNKQCENNSFDPVIGRDLIINKMFEILLRRSKNNIMLIGDAGVGKTALVEELSRRIVEGRAPKQLKDTRVLCLSLSLLVSGTKYRGEFEERLSKMIEEVEDDKNIILFIDEIHTLVGLGGAEGAIDASNILKPYLARGKLRLIGATTKKEYVKYIEKDKALDRRFQKIFISEATDEETIQILLKLKEIYENYHGVYIRDDIIINIVCLSNRFVSKGKQPDKAIDILDEVCAKTALIESSTDKRIRELSLKMRDMRLKINQLIVNGDYKEASKYKLGERQAETAMNRLLTDNKNIDRKKVTMDSVFSVIYEKTGIPVKDIINMDKKKAQKALNTKIVGQEEAISKILDVTFNRDYINKSVPKSLLLVGNSGVGKTLFVKEYNKVLFSNINLIRLDMSEYSESHSVSKIIGAPPGYVGYDNTDSILLKVKMSPYSVILLDEIEKASTKVLKLFLQVLDEGFLTDSTGEKVDFSNTTIFMTSNLGANKGSIGYSNNRDIMKKEITEFLGIELINRIDSIVVFKNLSEKSINKIIRNQLKNMKIDDIDRLVNEIREVSEYEKFGARRIDKIIEKKREEYLKMIC